MGKIQEASFSRRAVNKSETAPAGRETSVHYVPAITRHVTAMSNTVSAVFGTLAPELELELVAAKEPCFLTQSWQEPPKLQNVKKPKRTPQIKTAKACTLEGPG